MNRFRNLILCLLSAALALLGAEAVLSALHLGKPLKFEHELLLRWDRALGWAKRPNVTVFFATDEFSSTVTTNSKGERGPEVPYEKPSGEFRVLVLGDSFTEGYPTAFKDTYHQVFAAELGKRVRVLAMGTYGYNTEQELLLYQREGRRYSPDLVILQFCYNDVVSNLFTTSGLRKHTESGALSSTDERTDDPPFLSSPQDLIRESSESRNPVVRPVQRWVRKHSRLYTLLKALINGSLKKRPPAGEAAWRTTEALLAELDKKVDGDGGRLAVLYAPHWAAIYDPATGDRLLWGKSNDRYSDGLDSDDLTRRLGAICEKYGIPFVDPTPELRQLSKSSSTPLYFKRDSHWTVAGNKAVGKVLASRLSGMVPVERG